MHGMMGIYAHMLMKSWEFFPPMDTSVLVGISIAVQRHHDHRNILFGLVLRQDFSV